MRLAVDYGSKLINMGLEKSLQMLKESGFDGIDFDAEPVHLGDNYLEVAEEIRTLLDKIGLVCIQVHAPHDFVYETAMDFSNPIYRENFRSIEFAKILGADKCIIHCSAVPDGPLSGQFGEYNYIYYKTYEKEAQRCGIYIGVENLKNNLYRPDYMNKLLGMLNSPVYYPHVDIGHAISMGIEPDMFLKKLTCLPVRGMYVHDFNVQTDHILPFLGKINWDRMVKALVDVSYDGDLSIQISQMLQLISAYSVEILPALYHLTAEIGRELIYRIEEERKGNKDETIHYSSQHLPCFGPGNRSALSEGERL